MKKELYFYCRHISTPKEFHREFSKLLEFPSYYGHNLDDLWEFLTNYVESSTVIHFQYYEHLFTIFKEESEALRTIFERITMQNPKIEIIID